MSKNTSRGFTLIELITVCAIITIIVSIVLASIIDQKLKAHDAQRIEQLHQIANALEVYYSSNLQYPDPNYDPNNPNTPAYECDSRSPCWATLLPTPQYISSMPLDPVNNSCEGYMSCSNNVGEYYYKSNGSTYILSTYLATDNHWKTGLQWNNDAEIPAMTSPPYPSSHPLSSSAFFGPFYSIKGGSCTISDFWDCN